MLPDTPTVRAQQPDVARVDALLARALTPGGPPTAARDPLLGALEQVFARYCAILTERLNRTPDLHLHAFVAMLGERPEPAVPAHAPLVFHPSRAPDDASTAVVPKYTEVAGPAAAGAREPVVFQTVADLEVLRAEWVRAVAVDYTSGVAADAGGVISAQGLPAGVTPFAQPRPLVRALHIGHASLWTAPDLIGISVQADVLHARAPRTDADLAWGLTTPQGFVPLTPLADTTAGLTQRGEVSFGPLPAGVKIEPSPMQGMTTCWLTCRLVPRAQGAPAVTMPDAPLPATITRLQLTAERALKAAPVVAASFGRIPLDVSRDFYPFGERPRFGDVFYLASPGFDVPGARIVLNVRLTNPADAPPDVSPIPPVSRDGEPRVQWDIHTRDGWRALPADDTTRAFTANGALGFIVPDDAVPATVNGLASGWLRARLVAGSYAVGRRTSEPAALQRDAPPSIAQFQTTMSLRVGPLAPEQLIVEDGLEARVIERHDPEQATAFDPFPPYDLRGRALCLGLRTIPAQLAGHRLELYAGVAAHSGRMVCRDDDAAVALRWQVRGAQGWRDCAVIDGTNGLSRSGFLSVAIDRDVAVWRGNTLDQDPSLVWLRLTADPASAREGDAVSPLRLLALNAVPAIQAIRLEHELPGSGNGRPAQTIRLARSPVVGEIGLEVREGTQGAGHDWVRWSCVDDFGDAGPDDRVFCLDRTSGTLRFGDGLHGRMLPAGGNNVRASYSAGGGKRGNQPPFTIAQLRTTIPYVQSAANCDAAAGGQDAEDATRLGRAALARIRHRERAVCPQDYADLARRASPHVARAMCRGARDLSTDDGDQQVVQGVVSVLIAPDSAGPAPQPSRALVEQVKAFVAARCPAGVELIVLGPLYLRLNVDAQIAVASDASPARVVALCEARIDAFLHPVTGNDGGHGWAFGEEPHVSDLLAALEDVEGLDHVRGLRLYSDADAPRLRRRGDYLVCAGSLSIRAGE